MNRGFVDPKADLIWRGLRSRKLPDLAVPPGNRLEPLKADRQGQHSVRIADQWRICFVWTEGGPTDVEIVDDRR